MSTSCSVRVSIGLFLFEWYIYEVGLNVDETTELSRVSSNQLA